MKKQEFKKGEIVIYRTSDKEAVVNAILDKDTVWLSLIQIAQVFDTDKSGISRHIKNIYKSGELDQKSTVANFATVQN